MSIRIMTEVWQHSQHKGSELLLMLAIADNANDQGVAFPSLRTLARKTRLASRHVRRLLRVLEHSGELSISIGTGARGCNEYVIHPGQLVPRMKSTGDTQGPNPPDIAVSPEPNTKTKTSPNELTPTDLKRVGLTPGSLVWRSILGPDA
jgi:hypothetical protein